MKKTLFALTIALMVCTNLFAQEEKSYGPSAGNYAVGFSSDPIWEYIGNFFGKWDKNVAPSAYLSGGPGIFGKYYTTDDQAIRAGVNLNVQTVTDKTPSTDWEKSTQNSYSVSISMGLENRIGQGRLQAFYGPSAGLGFSSGSTSYSYDGEPMYGSIHRIKSGNQFSLAVGLFGGAEYFLSPKIALGTELGFGLLFLNRGNGSIERHQMDAEPYDTGRNAIYLGFQQTPAQMAPRGAIYFTFYF